MCLFIFLSEFFFNLWLQIQLFSSLQRAIKWCYNLKDCLENIVVSVNNHQVCLFYLNNKGWINFYWNSMWYCFKNGTTNTKESLFSILYLQCWWKYSKLQKVFRKVKTIFGKPKKTFDKHASITINHFKSWLQNKEPSCIVKENPNE